MPSTPAGPPRRGLTEQRRDQPAVHGEGSEPRLPHEHDESSDSQQQKGGDVRGVMRQAGEDLRKGREDTDRGPVLDRTYQRQKAGGDQTGTGQPKATRRR